MEELLACLSLSPLFRDLNPELLSDLASRAQRIELASGSALFSQGDEGDALYVVATGRLRASVATPSGEKAIGDAGRGDVVGEMAIIIGEPRAATVRAVRDSVLIRVGKQDVECLLNQHPASIMQLARMIVLRIRVQGVARARDTLRNLRTLAVAPAQPSGPAPDDFIVMLKAELTGTGTCFVVDSAAVDDALGTGHSQTPFDPGVRNSELLNWLSNLERDYRYLIYKTDEGMTAWTARCLRQADRILLLADAAATPTGSEVAEHIAAHGIQAPAELVLLHPGKRIESCRPLEWRVQTKAVAHHHVVAKQADDVPRLVRLITGQATGVVFGGGGARGFAHLGLIRALVERGKQIDLVGGTSIGALLGALVAQGRSLDEIRVILQNLFVANNFLNDYKLSRVSLIGGRKFRTQLDRIFGEQRIEELPIDYFCVSTNLTRGVAVVHGRGRLTDWVASSMTVPGIAPPVVWQGDLLVDGGLLNNVPTDIMQSMGRGIVIGSDVSNVVELRVEGVDSSEPQDLLRFGAAAKTFNLAKILFRSATLVDEDQVKARGLNADLYLRMPVQGIGTFDWQAAQVLEEQAFEYASAELDRFYAPKPEAGAESSDK